jgi:predicted nucleic acid-binding protein
MKQIPAPPAFYIETSVWGSLASRQPRDRTHVVRRLLRLLDMELGVCVISEVVLAEIRQAPVDEAKRLRRKIEEADPVVYSINDAMKSLAHAYIEADILPKTRDADALHVAAATCLKLDYLVSWNHRHMTRPMKRLQYESVNRIRGYLRTPLICNPFEACDELQH